MKTVHKVMAVPAMLWASYGVLLLIRAAMAFAGGRIQASPDGMQDAFIVLIFNLGFPCIVLFLLLRPKKEPWDKSK